MTIGDNYYQENPTHYVQPYIAQPYQYTYPQQFKKVRKVTTENEYDTEGRLVKETITEHEETVPYYPYTWGGSAPVVTFTAGVPNVEANTGQSIIDNINNHMKRTG